MDSIKLVKQLFLIFALMVFVFGSSVTEAHDISSQKLISHTVSIEYKSFIDDEVQWKTIGSGVLVRNIFPFNFNNLSVLTARHIIDGLDSDQELRVCSSIYMSSCINVKNWSKVGEDRLDEDYIFLFIDSLPRGGKLLDLKSSNSNLKLGDTVYQVGYPAGQFLYTEGKVAAILDRSEKIIMVHGYISQGSSGGPVFDAYGRLIGIMVAMPMRPIDDIPFASNGINDLAYVVRISKKRVISERIRHQQN